MRVTRNQNPRVRRVFPKKSTISIHKEGSLKLIPRRWRIKRWARSLKHVRYSDASEDRTRERDIFEVAVETPASESAFLDLCSSLGVVVKTIQPEDNVAQVGTPYKPDVWKTLKFPIPAFPHLAQPCEQIVAGAPVHVWIRGPYLEIVIAPAADPTRMDENDFYHAKAVDDLLSRHPALRFRGF